MHIKEHHHERVQVFCQGRLLRDGEREIRGKTAAATGVSVCTVERVKAEVKASPDMIIVLSPPTARPLTVMGTVDNFNKHFYERGEIPTIDKLLTSVKEPPISFKGSRTSLYSTVRQMGFRY